MRRHLRHTNLEPRFEMMPLIDVVFLLLTFFIYAMVLMVRAHLLPVQLPTLSSGIQAMPMAAISITIDAHGALFVDAQPVELDEVVERVMDKRRDEPGARVYVAADLEGQADRLPIFVELINRLRGSGLDEFFIVGQPTDEP